MSEYFPLKDKSVYSSKFKYVKAKKRKKYNSFYYEVNVKIDGKSIYLGRYDTEIEAGYAYNEKAKELFGYNTRLNYLTEEEIQEVLKLKKEIDEFYEANKAYPINTSEMLENALELKSNTINNIHNFIYSVPKSTVMFNYVNQITNRYNILISRITDSIYKSYLKSIDLNGINANTKFVSYNTTKPYDPKLNHPIIPNTEDKLIQYYI